MIIKTKRFYCVLRNSLSFSLSRSLFRSRQTKLFAPWLFHFSPPPMIREWNFFMYHIVLLLTTWATHKYKKNNFSLQLLVKATIKRAMPLFFVTAITRHIVKFALSLVCVCVCVRSLLIFVRVHCNKNMSCFFGSLFFSRANSWLNFLNDEENIEMTHYRLFCQSHLINFGILNCSSSIKLLIHHWLLLCTLKQKC